MTSIAIPEALEWELHTPRDIAPRYVFYMKGKRVFATTIIGSVPDVLTPYGGKLEEIYVDPEGVIHYFMR